MARYSLATYTIRIKDKVRDIYVPINNIQNGTDFLNVMDNYLSNRNMNMAHQQAQRKLLKIRKKYGTLHVKTEYFLVLLRLVNTGTRLNF